ncbi:phosphoglycerate mutase [Dyella mobilis]|uniref:Phosphoglycerate mutase n=1 Tax=Dyella mobilis TaxID=1849582 RepID=A0ABS2KAY6_9GAMM|nr:phosphoglycerate mutase [Dyella mobilis]MBM7128341.1 phosphoglycerate mutase [Dyella mobilis]GLQ99644.1 hypothetical protein GCM10007863_40640 [Dyella mobilis]
MSDLQTRAVECWLPDLQRFDALHPLRSLLRRADRLDPGAVGYLGGLAAFFHCAEGLPAAALIREYLAGDAADACWLSADPSWLQPDLSGARLMACGHLQLNADEALALAETLKPVFADAGMALDISSPDRWHLRLPPGTALPDFDPPESALGEDLYEHLPQGEEGRRWRVLLNEVQVLLHQHPINAQRRTRGLPPVNTVWLWGAGALPSQVTTKLTGVISQDPLLLALAKRAGIPSQPREQVSVSAAGRGWLVDLQDLPVVDLASAWWPVLQAQARRQPLLLAFASGERYLHRPWHRMRVWRGS